jgi:hypothetical protein
MEDQMTELGPTERRLLLALRAADEPTDADRTRVRARVLAKLGVASGVVSIAAKSAAAPAAASWKVGAAIVAVIGATGGAAWFAATPEASPAGDVTTRNTPRASDRHAKPAQANEPPRPIAESQERGASSPALDTARTAEARAQKPPAAARQPSADLDGELALLEGAQQALKQGDSARALAQLERHAAEHPAGVLATERIAIRAVALCESGKMTEGQREAKRFLERNPKSPLAVRVRAACFGTKSFETRK